MGRKVGIAAEQVVDVAARIADRDGLSAVTLAGVAAALGVRSPSLYAHVDGLPGLHRALAHRAFRLLAEWLAAAAASEPHDPLAALRAVAYAYRAFATERPGLYAALLPAPRPDLDPEGAARAAVPVEVIAAVLADLGVADEEHVDVIRALRALLHGFVHLELGHGFGLAEPVDDSFELALDLLLAGIDATRHTHAR